MKPILYILFSTILFTSCTNKVLIPTKDDAAEVVKDCTGMYLRINKSDYQVCNTEKLDNINNGIKVHAKYKKINECHGTASQAVVCMMYHANEGWIEIESVY